MAGNKAGPAPQVAGQMTQASPLTYTNSTTGVAGSAGNESNNKYSFAITRFGGNTRLVFYGFGKRGDNSYGDVYLTTPSGTREQVAEWSPRNLKAINIMGVKGYKDVAPIEADISKLVTQAGNYLVEFKYKDGNEALNIFRVELQTW